MKLKLTVTERLVLFQILPEEASFATKKIVEDLRNELALQDKEREKIEYRLEGNRVLWNPEKEHLIEKEMDFGKYELDVIKAALEELDKEEKIRAEHLSLYEKIMK